MAQPRGRARHRAPQFCGRPPRTRHTYIRTCTNCMQLCMQNCCQQLGRRVVFAMAPLSGASAAAAKAFLAPTHPVRPALVFCRIPSFVRVGIHPTRVSRVSLWPPPPVSRAAAAEVTCAGTPRCYSTIPEQLVDSPGKPGHCENRLLTVCSPGANSRTRVCPRIVGSGTVLISSQNEVY